MGRTQLAQCARALVQRDDGQLLGCRGRCCNAERGWSHEVGRHIAPIGELAGGACGLAWLGIDEQDEVYLVVDRLATFGRLPVAMDHLVLGYMPERIS